MTDKERKEEEVFSQKISPDELDAVTGGVLVIGGGKKSNESNQDACWQVLRRQITVGGHVNCAATVEDGSLCKENDACFGSAIVYQGLKDCSKAWM